MRLLKMLSKPAAWASGGQAQSFVQCSYRLLVSRGASESNLLAVLGAVEVGAIIL